MNRPIGIVHVAIVTSLVLACESSASDKIASGAAAPAAPLAAVTLPADPRIASADPEMRALLEDRKRSAGEVCILDNEKAGAQSFLYKDPQQNGKPVYDCVCYADKVVITTLDISSTISHIGEQHAAVLTPPIEIVVSDADLHSCLNPALLPKRAYDEGLSMTGMFSGEKKLRVAQCTSDDTMAAHKAKPAHDIWSFDDLVRYSYSGCALKVH